MFLPSKEKLTLWRLTLLTTVRGWRSCRLNMPCLSMSSRSDLTIGTVCIFLYLAEVQSAHHSVVNRQKSFCAQQQKKQQKMPACQMCTKLGSQQQLQGLMS